MYPTSLTSAAAAAAAATPAVATPKRSWLSVANSPPSSSSLSSSTFNEDQKVSQMSLKEVVDDLLLNELPEGLPEDIQALTACSNPTYATLRKLREWKVARDTLIVWDKITKSKDGFPPEHWGNGEEMLARAQQFDDWVKIKKAELRFYLYQDLHLSHLQLSHLPPAIGLIIKELNLESIDLSGNLLVSIPDCVHSPSLKKVDLRDNQLQTLPNWIGDLPKLEVLDVGNNQLKELPCSMQKLSALRILVLDRSPLVRFPGWMSQLTNLQILVLDFLNLTTLPESIKSLNLQELSLRGNQLSALPKWICNFSALRYLNLSRNDLRELPRGLRQKSLLILDDSHNPLSRTPHAIRIHSGQRDPRITVKECFSEYLNQVRKWIGSEHSLWVETPEFCSIVDKLVQEMREKKLFLISAGAGYGVLEEYFRQKGIDVVVIDRLSDAWHKTLATGYDTCFQGEIIDVDEKQSCGTHGCRKEEVEELFDQHPSLRNCSNAVMFCCYPPDWDRYSSHFAHYFQFAQKRGLTRAITYLDAETDNCTYLGPEKEFQAFKKQLKGPQASVTFKKEHKIPHMMAFIIRKTTDRMTVYGDIAHIISEGRPHSQQESHRQ